MVRSARRRAALLTTVALLCAPAVALGQSGAGDQQYEDPLGGQTQSTPTRTTTTPATTTTTSAAPAASPSTGSAASPAATSATTASSSAPAASLPRTGLNAGVVAALGLAALLMGLGLRLRTADGHG